MVLPLPCADTLPSPNALATSLARVHLKSKVDRVNQFKNKIAAYNAKRQKEQQAKRDELQRALEAKLSQQRTSSAYGGCDDAVCADVENLLAQIPGLPRGSTAMQVDGDDTILQQDHDYGNAQQGDEDSDGPGDGGGFD
jgi:hypothetical protein